MSKIEYFDNFAHITREKLVINGDVYGMEIISNVRIDTQEPNKTITYSAIGIIVFMINILIISVMISYYLITGLSFLVILDSIYVIYNNIERVVLIVIDINSNEKRYIKGDREYISKLAVNIKIAKTTYMSRAKNQN